VKNRADLLLFWGGRPAETHPRLADRYALAPPGRFAPNGRRDRTVIVAGNRSTADAYAAEVFLPVTPGEDFAALWLLRALVQGKPVDPALAPVAGVPLAEWQALADRLQHCKFGVLFLDPAPPAHMADRLPGRRRPAPRLPVFLRRRVQRGRCARPRRDRRRSARQFRPARPTPTGGSRSLTPDSLCRPIPPRHGNEPIGRRRHHHRRLRRPRRRHGLPPGRTRAAPQTCNLIFIYRRFSGIEVDRTESPGPERAGMIDRKARA
jgi:hypothetical protein